MSIVLIGIKAIPLFENQMCCSIFATSILLKDLIPQSQNDKIHSLESYIKIKWGDLLRDPMAHDLMTIIYSTGIILII